MSDRMKVIAGDRQSGKTEALLRWVLEGDRCKGYPGWTRILIVPTTQDELRLRPVAKELSGLPWPEIDYTHRVFAWDDWKGVSRSPGLQDPLPEARVDGLDRLVARELPWLSGWRGTNVTGFSIDEEADVEVMTHEPR